MAYSRMGNMENETKGREIFEYISRVGINIIFKNRDVLFFITKRKNSRAAFKSIFVNI